MKHSDGTVFLDGVLRYRGEEARPCWQWARY